MENAEAAGSSNYVLTIPIFSLAGRGLNLNLALTYNSQLWHDSGGGVIDFDPDVGWPVAGWALGFRETKEIRHSAEAKVSLCCRPDGFRL